MKFNIKNIFTRFTMALFLMSILTISSLFLIHSQLNEVHEKVDDMATSHSNQVQLASDLIIDAQDRIDLVKNVVLIDDPVLLKEEFLRFVEARENYARTSSSLKQIFIDGQKHTSDRELDLMAIIESKSQRFFDYENQMLNLGLLNEDKAAVAIYQNQARPVYIQWRESMDQLLHIELALNRQASQEVRKLEQSIQFSLLLIGSITLLASIFVISYFKKSIGVPLSLFAEDLEALTQEKFGRKVHGIELQNEIGYMARAIDQLQKVLISRTEERWIKTCLNEIMTDLQAADSYQELADCFTRNLCRLAGATQAIFYSSSQTDEKLIPIVGYGGAHITTAYSKDEGLVGQALKEGKELYIDIPSESNLHWTSGLLKGLPYQVVFLPIIHNKKPLGVLELGLLQSSDAATHLLFTESIAALAPILEVQCRSEQSNRLLEELKENSIALAVKQQALIETQSVLTENNGLLNGILSAATGLAIISTNKDGLITTFNSGAEQLFGCTADSVINRLKPNDFLSASVNEKPSFLNIVSVALTQAADIRELTFINNQGNEFTGEIHINLIHDVAGEVLGYTIIVRDVTIERQVEFKMAEARRVAEDAARQKSEFLANMSHEIRTPMNAIIGMTYLAQKTDLTARQSEYLAKIQKSSQHLLGIINDILDISKIEAGMLRIENVPFELESVLANVVSLMNTKAAEKGLDLALDIGHDVPVELIGDPLRVVQILTNYAFNAVKFTDKGEISIKVRLLERDADTVVLKFSVQDTGIGLSEEQKGCLFAAFSQADTSTTRKYGGTGLGLVISKNLAEQMNGEVGVESELGIGSTFWFTVRLGLGHLPHKKILFSADLRGHHVLVVDDNDNAREVMREMLSNMGFEVTEAASGKEAIDLVKLADGTKHPLELVFMDWHMPAMNGIEALRQIKALTLAEPPSLLLVTAYGREEVFAQAENGGLTDILVKPFSDSTLFDTIMRALHHNVAGERRVAANLTPLEALNGIAGARLLLVEDNELNQEVALELLRQARFVVDLAPNGQIALSRLQEHQYDLVLMDMQMPVMDGLEATWQIRQIPALNNLPIVAMTANALEEDRNKCMLAGMNDFVSKPIDPEHLWDVLLKWIPKRQDVASSIMSAANVLSLPNIDFEVAGIESAPALRRMLGRMDLYLNTLRKFCKNHADTVELITKELAVDNWTSAQRHAHTLKGIAATIGAMELSRLSAALEQALKERQPSEVAHQLLEPIGSSLHGIISELLIKLPPEAAAEKPVELSDAIFAIKQLENLLMDSDPDAVSFMENNIAALRLILSRTRITEIEAAIRNFDLNDALRLLLEAKTEKEAHK